MIIRKDYVLELYDSDNNTSIAEFEFNSKLEVKQFLKHLGESNMTRDNDYTMKLYERTTIWTVQEGTVFRQLQQVTEDF